MAKGRISIELDGIARRTRAVAVRNLREALTLLRDETRKSVSVQGSRNNRSKPGQPPKRQTGELHDKIDFEIDEERLEGRVFSSAPYSKYLENGTPRMAARPFLGPAYRRVRARIVAILQRRK